MAAKAKAKEERKGYVVPADAASEPRAFALPNPAYQAEVDGVMMYEYHVDAAEVFLQWRLEQPLHGSFSLRWGGQPTAPPSAPPPEKELLEPGTEITPPTAAPAAPADAPAPGAEGAPAIMPDAAAPACHLTKSDINGKTPAELREELARLHVALPAAGSGANGNVVKIDLVNLLWAHSTKNKQGLAAAAAAPAAAAPAATDAGTPKVTKVLARRTTARPCPQRRHAALHSALTPPGRAQEKQSTLGDTVLYVEWRVVWGDGEPEWMSDGALLGASGFAEACVNFLAEVPVPSRPRRTQKQTASLHLLHDKKKKSQLGRRMPTPTRGVFAPRVTTQTSAAAPSLCGTKGTTRRSGRPSRPLAARG